MTIKYSFKKLKWNIKNYYLKKEYKVIPIINMIKTITICIIALCSYIYIMTKLNIIIFSDNNWIKFNDIEFKEIYNDLVIAQISSTFLTTAVLSLISSIENKHILGEKETNLLFGKRLQGFYIPMFTLYIIMCINIVLLIEETSANIIVVLFFLSIYILIYIITKIGTIFVSTKKYTNKLYSKYYKEAQSNIFKIIPPRDYENKLLFNLKDNTIGLIAENNLLYMKNVNMYKVIIDRLLFNIPNDVQKYHLDMNYAPSIINDFMEVIEHFLYFKETTRAIQCYNWLLSRLNFHNIYIPFNNMDCTLNDLVNKLTDLKNEYEVEKYLDSLSPIITNIEIQEYYALTNDYSNTGLPDIRQGYIYHHKSKYFEQVYDKIYTNQYLNKVEKINCFTKIYDMFRLSAHNGCNIIRDITNYSFDFKEAKKREMPPCIVGQATTLLLLRTLKNKDERSFKLFLGMNIEGNEMSFAIHCLLLSLISMKSNKGDKNIYSDYYGVDFEYCKEIINRKSEYVFTELTLWNKKTLIEQIQSDYNYIIKNCTEEKQRDKLFLEYILKFDKSLINEYFIKLSKKYKKSITLQNDKEKKYIKLVEEYINNRK